MIYAFSSYLDTMSEHWDALVLNDYEAVMPLTWKKKYRIHYLYQPAFTACLGVFGKQIDAGMLNAFLRAVPAKFKYWDIYFNYGNFFSLQDFKLYERSNYVLNLNDRYEMLSGNYRENIKRNIRKSEQLDLVIKRNIPVVEVIALAKEQGKRFSAPVAKDYKRFENLYSLLYKKEKATAYGVFTGQNELISAAVFFFSQQRAYYILAANHPNGKTLGASHALINSFIKDNAGNDLVLDFEGSDISSLAFFYSSFGAKEEKYCGIKLNKLPAVVKWMKK